MTRSPDGTITRERPASLATSGADVPVVVHGEWADRFPWLIQATTCRGHDGFDLGLAGDRPVRDALARWWALREATGTDAVVVARQVHGPVVLQHDAAPPGIALVPPADGHLTDRAGLLLAITVADCVPVFLVAPDTRAVALLHAGWRGTAAGILEAGIAALRARTGQPPATFHIHLGPAICGRCYEVGPEVHAALGRVAPGAPAPVDLRAELAYRARRAGLRAEAITRSAWCTRCDRTRFYSHRGGDAGRQAGLLGVRAPS